MWLVAFLSRDGRTLEQRSPLKSRARVEGRVWDAPMWVSPWSTRHTCACCAMVHGLMSLQPHRLLHLLKIMLNFEKKIDNGTNIKTLFLWLGLAYRRYENGAGVDSATWGAPRTNFPLRDIALVTFKSAEQTVKWANPSDSSAFCLVVSKSLWNSFVLYRVRRAWSWPLYYFPFFRIFW